MDELNTWKFQTIRNFSGYFQIISYYLISSIFHPTRAKSEFSGRHCAGPPAPVCIFLSFHCILLSVMLPVKASEYIFQALLSFTTLFLFFIPVIFQQIKFKFYIPPVSWHKKPLRRLTADPIRDYRMSDGVSRRFGL